MRCSTILVIIVACFGLSTELAEAADWLQFRGPNEAGLSADKGLPATWSGDANVAWKTDMPGAGSSSPIVVGNKIFLTCYSGYGVKNNEGGERKDLRRHLLCLARDTGKELWKRTAETVLPEEPYRDFLALHGYASSTPASDGERVFVFFGKSGVLAFNLSGEQLWHTSVGKGAHGWGSGTSPILYKDLLLVNASVESRALIALNKKTGKEVWRAKGISESWSTPVLVNVPGGKTELVVSGSHKVLGFDPETGDELWHADSFNWYVCPTVVAHDGVVYALQNSTCVAVRAGGRGDVTASHTVWQKKRYGSVVSSAVFHDGLVYWATDGTATCVRAKDGSEVYRSRLNPSSGNLYASPVVADGKIYYVSRNAGTYVVEAGQKFKLLAHNTLNPDNSVFNASPVVSDSQLLLRSDRALYCIGKKQ
jgi:outer membrane protein assembly factor BamB